MSRASTNRLIRERNELTRQNGLLLRYVFDYGNANRLCGYGYPQHPNLICGLCGHDDSNGKSCPKAALPKEG